MVLGVDWMKGVSPISFDINRMEVSIEKEGRRMILTGGKEAGTCKMITGKRLQKVLKGKWSQLASLFSIVAAKELHGGYEKAYLTINSIELLDQVNHLDCINELLAEYKDLCMEPKSLPPTKSFDHAIHLKPNTKPINVRSYRYPPLQKSEIEKMVREMLQRSIIRPSQSPFTSPVLLVKKKMDHSDFV